jgi:hypothetical protein
MGVMDALTRTAYDPEENVADGEQTPASQQVERPHLCLRPSAGAGGDNKSRRALVNAATELAHSVK